MSSLTTTAPTAVKARKPATALEWLRRFAHACTPSMPKLRVTVYAASAFAVCAVVGSRLVMADVGEATFAASRELAHLGDLTAAHETLIINGESMHRASAYTTQSVHEVLDRYEAYCAASPSVLGRAVEDIPAALKEKALKGVPVWLRLGIVRDESAKGGVVSCFADDRPGGVSALKGRVQSYLKTGNLSEFGRFRHVFAEPSTHPGETHVVTMWSDGDLNVGKMFPRQGDATGTDSPLMPRPADSRRLLSAAAVGMPFGVRMYESKASVADVRAFYDGVMAAKNWQVVDGANAAEAEGMRVYMRDDGLQVFVQVSESDQKTFATIVETGRPNVSNMATGNVGQNE